ncbi:MAG: methionyl-tRNA formyltransferase [Candidatus Colwellbacteria bacterium]|nr:methionyl-tRNA formyltransferase [Candidatus Colwellbacteria bacterium]
MKFVFFGTPRFAAAVLGRLIEKGSAPIALVTNPDMPVGRKKIITPPETKTLILKTKSGIPILQPKKIDAEFLERLNKLEADIFVVAAYGKMLPQKLLDIPRYGVINIHPSILPKYRGASPVQSAILDGENETGVTLFKIDEAMDHGPLYCDKKVEIKPEDNTPSMFEKLAVAGADLLIDRLFPNIDILSPVPQTESAATYTRKFATSDGFIEYSDLKKAETEGGSLANMIDRKIRAFYPEPGCWTMEGPVRIKLLDSVIEDGKLRLKIIQKEGKKPVIL